MEGGIVPPQMINQEKLSDAEIQKSGVILGQQVTNTASSLSGGKTIETSAQMQERLAEAARVKETPRGIKARQPWSQYQIEEPLGPVDVSIPPAIRANLELGFHDKKIKFIRKILNLRIAPPVIKRRFIEAVRQVQSACSNPEKTSFAGDADILNIQPDNSNFGVLDEDTIFALNINWGRKKIRNARMFYINKDPWKNLSHEKFSDIRNAIIGPLRVNQGDICIEVTPKGRHKVVVTDNFIFQVVKWQLWHHRQSASEKWGRLDEETLAELGAPVSIASKYTSPLEKTEKSEQVVEKEQSGDASTSDLSPESDETRRDEQGLTRQQREQLQDMLVSIDKYFLKRGRVVNREKRKRRKIQNELKAKKRKICQKWQSKIDDTRKDSRRQGEPRKERIVKVQKLRGNLNEELSNLQKEGDARLKEIKEEHKVQSSIELEKIDKQQQLDLETMRSEIEKMRLPNANFNRFDQFLRTKILTGWMKKEIEILLGHQERRASSSANQSSAESPLERRTLKESMSTLEGEELIIERSSLVRERWNERLLKDSEPLADTSRNAVLGLENLKSNMEDWLEQLEAAISSPSSQLEETLVNLAKVEFTVPSTVRTQWKPALPKKKTEEQIRSDSEKHQLRYAKRWLRALQQILHGKTRKGIEQEISRNKKYGQSIYFENPRAVKVDLHRTGITVTRNPGTPLPPKEIHLDPVFADAMVRFLHELHSLGVTEMRTCGFLRDPMSPADTHPQGRACDITGFQFSDQLLHLRSGYPMRPPQPDDSPKYVAEYNNIFKGHSDWFDHTGKIGDMSHERILHAITNIMRKYFSKIIGPGSNGLHMGHWHVELTEGTNRGVQVNAIALDADQPDWVSNRARNRYSEWRTPGEE
jgi:hypothetical protein